MSREPQWTGSRISADDDDGGDDEPISVHRAADGSIDIMASVAPDDNDTQITIVSHVELVYEQNPDDVAEIQAMRHRMQRILYRMTNMDLSNGWRGLCDFTSEELRVLAVNPHLDAEQLLGYRTKGEVIRAKNLVLLEGRHLLWDAPRPSEASAA